MTSTALVLQSRAVLHKHARSFSWAAPFLPIDARDDAAVVYAFCRLVDDTADEAPSRAEARIGLDRIERALADASLASGTHVREHTSGDAHGLAVVAGYAEVARRRGIPDEAARGLLAGARADVDERVRIADDAALQRYCFQVAGTVGLMMQALIGARHADARGPAVDLGIGMQLTNIARDVAEDARNDRVYLPATALAAYGLSHDDVIDAVTNGGAHGERARAAHAAALVAAVHALLERAEERYRSAARGLAFIPWRARIAVAVALRVYRAIGGEVERLGARVLTTRAVVPAWRKALELLAGVALAVAAPWLARSTQVVDERAP